MWIKRIALLYVFTLLSTPTTASQSASLSGHIIESGTGAPVASAKVFLSGTMIGTSSDACGAFIFEEVPEGIYELVIHKPGYDLHVVRITKSPTRAVEKSIELKARQNDTAEEQFYEHDSGAWNTMWQRFRKAFIGDSGIASKSTILNPHVLKFQMITEGDSKTLTASADSILEIENLAFGYRIEIAMAYFRLIGDTLTQYQVYPRFSQIQTEDKKQLEFWRKNQKQTYEGSMRQFLQSLANASVEQEGFEVYKNSCELLLTGYQYYIDPDSLDLKALQPDYYKIWHFKECIMVRYKNKMPNPWSILKLRKPYAMIDGAGNLLTSKAFSLSGHWYEARVAELLPREYEPD